MESTQVRPHGGWNKGKLVGQKAPFKLKEIWAIPIRLEIQGRLQTGRTEVGQLPVPQPGPRITPLGRAPVRSYCS